MAQTHYQVLVIGGGNAGLSVAAHLLRRKPSLSVGIIEPSEKHYYQPAWTLVGGGVYDINKTVRPEAQYIPKGATWIQDYAEQIQPESNTVITRRGERYTYDCLVVCPGLQLDWHKIKGAEQWLGKRGITSIYTFATAPYTYECIRSFTGKGKALFTAPNTPIKCGGAPQKIMYLAADSFRRRGILRPDMVHFYSGGSVIFSVQKYAQVLQKVCQRYQIGLHFFHNCVEIDGENKVAYFEAKQGDTTERIAVEFEMIHITPPQSAPDFIKRSPLAVPNDPLGWMEVDKFTLQHPRYRNVFGIGDVTNTPNAKTGAAIRKQNPVLVENLLYCIEHNTTTIPAPKTYNGYGSCPLITGYGRLMLAEFDYDNQPQETFPFDQGKERFSMWLLKKEILPRLYWGAILRGRMQG